MSRGLKAAGAAIFMAVALVIPVAGQRAGGPVPPAFSTPQGQTPKYIGAPADFDFQGVDLRTVLRAFAEISGLNLVIDPAVKGTVDIKLTQVPWDQALEVILKSSKLWYIVDGNVVRIVPVDVLSAEAIERQQLADTQAPAALVARTFTLSYAKGAALETLLKTTETLSKYGTAYFDDRTNTLIVRDLPERLDGVGALILALDKAQPQVEIEARIVLTNRDSARELGVQWGFNGRVAPELGNTTGLAFPNQGSVGGRIGRAQGPGDARASPFEATSTAINLPVNTPTSAVGVAMGAINGAFNLDVALSALESSGKLRILSSPRVTTQNNRQAEMTQGTQIPIQTSANNTVSVTFKDAALKLLVTPQITAAGTVIMEIELENSAADFSKAVNNIPPIDTQRARTFVQVQDGATTIIGGIVVSREQSSSHSTPGLHRLPLLGWLFRKEVRGDESSELLIFITPRIIRSTP